MQKEVKLNIIEVKSLTHYIVKEIDSQSANNFRKLEEVIQKTYAIPEENRPKQEYEIGSHVCVLINADSHNRRAPKKWVRAVVRQILMAIGSYLFDVYLLDYGLRKVVKSFVVRELRPHFGEEFVKHQAMNFHLSDTELKPDVNTEDNRKLVEDLFESNNYLVSGMIIKETNTNLLGTIKLDDGSDIRHLFIQKGLSVEKQFEIRKPKTSPIFKTTVKQPNSNGIHINRRSLEYSTEINDSDASIGSIDSTDISVASDSSIESVDVNSSGPDLLDKEINDLKRTEGGKLNQLFTRIKLNKQMKEMSSNGGTINTDSSERSESPIEYVEHYNSKSVDIMTDWPELSPEDCPSICHLKPAGSHTAIPPMNKNQRIYTLTKR